MSDKVVPGGCSCGAGQQDSCCGGSDCCGEPAVKKKQIVIDFLYRDLNTCSRCQDTDAVLAQTLKDPVVQVLTASGVQVVINKVHVANEELAKQHKFISSPTIRVNGRDIQADVRESRCESCGEDVHCRVWVHQGKEFSAPPKTMIIEAILKAVYGHDGC